MSNEFQKTPLYKSLDAFTAKKINDALQAGGKFLPAHVVKFTGTTVTVAFDIQSDFTLPQVTMPLFGPEYVRYPIKAGDKGLCLSADTYIGGVSGIGGGTATLGDIGNLESLVFLPISNTGWAGVDITSVVVYGPNGVVLRDSGSNSVFTLTPTSITIVSPTQVKATVGGTTLTLSTAGWSLSGASGSMADGAHGTSPTVMNAAWTALVNWANAHQHTSTGATSVTSMPNTPFTGSNIAP